MFDRLRRYDAQATFGAMMSVASLVAWCLAAFLTLQRYHADLAQIIYGSKSLFLPALLALVGCSLLMGFGGALLGWNSAAQRRNERQGRSWLAFFAGATACALNVILLLAFAMLRFEKPM